MKRSIGQLLLVTNLIFSGSLFGQIYVTDSQVQGSWVDTTYIIQTNINISSNSTLTIAPGATIKFDGNYAFEVRGSLIANGT